MKRIKKEKRKTNGKCQHHKFKIVKTHGEKSRGYKVCKICGGVIR